MYVITYWVRTILGLFRYHKLFGVTCCGAASAVVVAITRHHDSQTV